MLVERNAGVSKHNDHLSCINVIILIFAASPINGNYNQLMVRYGHNCIIREKYLVYM